MADVYYYVILSCGNDGSGHHSLHHLVRLLSQVKPTKGRIPSATAAP